MSINQRAIIRDTLPPGIQKRGGEVIKSITKRTREVAEKCGTLCTISRGETAIELPSRFEQLAKSRGPVAGIVASIRHTIERLISEHWSIKKKDLNPELPEKTLSKLEHYRKISTEYFHQTKWLRIFLGDMWYKIFMSESSGAIRLNNAINEYIRSCNGSDVSIWKMQKILSPLLHPNKGKSKSEKHTYSVSGLIEVTVNALQQWTQQEDKERDSLQARIERNSIKNNFAYLFEGILDNKETGKKFQKLRKKYGMRPLSDEFLEYMSAHETIHGENEEESFDQELVRFFLPEPLFDLAVKIIQTKNDLGADEEYLVPELQSLVTFIGETYLFATTVGIEFPEELHNSSHIEIFGEILRTYPYDTQKFLTALHTFAEKIANYVVQSDNFGDLQQKRSIEKYKLYNAISQKQRDRIQKITSLMQEITREGDLKGIVNNQKIDRKIQEIERLTRALHNLSDQQKEIDTQNAGPYWQNPNAENIYGACLTDDIEDEEEEEDDEDNEDGGIKVSGNSSKKNNPTAGDGGEDISLAAEEYLPIAQVSLEDEDMRSGVRSAYAVTKIIQLNEKCEVLYVYWYLTLKKITHHHKGTQLLSPENYTKLRDKLSLLETQIMEIEGQKDGLSRTFDNYILQNNLEGEWAVWKEKYEKDIGKMHDWAVEKSVRNMSDEAFCLLQIIQGSGSDEDDPIKRQIDYFDMRKFLFYEMSGIQGSLEDLLEDRRIVGSVREEIAIFYETITRAREDLFGMN